VVKTLITLIVAAALLVVGVVWYYQPDRVMRAVGRSPVEEEPADDAWLDHLYSQNTRDAAEAVRHVEMLGERAVPIIQATLANAGSDREHRKAALKASGILGEVAAPAIPLVATELAKPELTAEAALALSFMGRKAFAPLRDALTSDEPVVRREALRSIGKLKERAPLDTNAVLPLLLAGLQDADPAVRGVAATYLGIIHEGGDAAVPALVAALQDPDVEVRRASAEALGSFGAQAESALPALRKASSDKDPEVAREAGLAIVKLQSKEE
jgi:HEAT repeat protein